jgi:hypothetical protein
LFREFSWFALDRTIPSSRSSLALPARSASRPEPQGRSKYDCFLMAFNLVLLLGAAFIIGSTLALFQRSRRNILLERLRVGGRRVSGARTPPRSLSPSQKTELTPEVDHSNTFPPSQRSALARIFKDEELDEPTEDWTKDTLPIEMSYLDADDTKRLPCGFSVKEIKALGDFPDYAALSGVPLPAPYPEFDINKALPRPYRPFRWPYHQTMCKCLLNKVSF